MAKENISDEQLLINIKWAELETKAYRDIAEGFLVLSTLPETEIFTAYEYINKYKKYIALWESASDFLGQLYLKKSERNLD